VVDAVQPAGVTAPGPPVVTLATEPDVADVGLRAKERAENFPVALRVLPRAVRADLRAVYDVVRTVDDLGDELAEQRPGHRTAALEAFRADLARVWSTGSPSSAVLTRLVPTVRRHSIPPDPFDRLVRANLADQRVPRYATFEDLLGYCDLSAAPIGELVLHIGGAATPERIALSDRVCAALQVAEHLQDVAEDRARGRVYLPQQDLAAHGVAEADLDAPTASPALRALVAALADRVDGLLDSGLPLVAGLTGWSRLAVAGYVAGGRAALDGLRRVDGDVLGGSPGVRRRDLLQHVAGVLLAALHPGLRGSFPC
jgi:squalene synthase HpnC